MVILERVFPNSDIAFSTPVEFLLNKSLVAIKGNPGHLKILYEYLRRFLECDIRDVLFGEWIGLELHSGEDPRIILYYLATEEMTKVRLLCTVLSEHLARFFDLCLLPFPEITLKIKGETAYRGFVIWPLDFNNGKKEIFGRAKDAGGLTIH